MKFFQKFSMRHTAQCIVVLWIISSCMHNENCISKQSNDKKTIFHTKYLSQLNNKEQCNGNVLCEA